MMHHIGSCVYKAVPRRVLVFTRGYASAASAAPNATASKQSDRSTLSKHTYASLLSEKTSKFEHKDLLIAPAEDIRHTFIEVNDKVDGLARGFVEHVVRPGDTLVSLLPDTSVQLYTQLAAARAGITYVPYSPNIPTATLLNKLKSTNARGLIVPDVIGSRNYIQELYDAVPELDAVTEEFQPFKSKNQLPNLKLLAHSSDKRYQGFLRLSTIPVRGLTPDPLRKLAAAPVNQPALLLPQANSDAVDQISQSNLISTGHAILEALSATISDRIAIGTPYDSIAYYLFAGCISHGVAVVQPSKSFNADSIVRSVGRDKVTILVVSAKDVPSILQSKELARTDVSSLKTVLIWGQLDAGLVSNIKEKLKVKDVFAINHVAGHTGQLTGVMQTADGKGKLLPNVEGKIDGQSLRTKGGHVLASGDGKNSAESWLDTKLQTTADASGAYTFAK